MTSKSFYFFVMSWIFYGDWNTLVLVKMNLKTVRMSSILIFSVFGSVPQCFSKISSLCWAFSFYIFHVVNIGLSITGYKFYMLYLVKSCFVEMFHTSIACFFSAPFVLFQHITFFSLYYLAAQRPTLGHWRGGSLTGPMLITPTFLVPPDGHQEPCNEL